MATAEPPPPIIRLMDSSGTIVMDSVSAEYEDSFSLESFEDLVNMHYECEPKGSRSFVIARVQTWDHKQPEKVKDDKPASLFFDVKKIINIYLC